MITVLIGTVAIAAWNNTLHLVPSRWRETSTSVGVGMAGALAAAWLATNRDPSFARGHAVGLVWLVGTATLAALVVLGVKRIPAALRHLRDDRIGTMPARRFAAYAFLRIPLVSALAEELLFRGLVWSLLSGVAGPWWALAGSSVAFALWHVVVSAHQARRMGRPVPSWVSASLATTFVAGIGFGLVRMITGGVWAPAAVHATINVGSAVVARIAHRHERQTVSA